MACAAGLDERMDPVRKFRLPGLPSRMPERFMVTGYDRRNSGGRILSQILQEVRGVIWTCAFHDLGEHELGLTDRAVKVVARFTGQGADLNRKMGDFGGIPARPLGTRLTRYRLRHR